MRACFCGVVLEPLELAAALACGCPVGVGVAVAVGAGAGVEPESTAGCDGAPLFGGGG